MPDGFDTPTGMSPQNTLRFLVPETGLLLGQSFPLSIQLTGPDGHGLTSQRITCVTSDGLLTAREGLDFQSGGAVSLQPEPGGLVSLTFGPRLFPPPGIAATAALNAALTDPEARSDSRDATGEWLQGLASRYRGEGSEPLRTAIDRLFDTFPADSRNPTGTWPVLPVILIAMAENADGQVTAISSLTLRLRNWLGAFRTALSDRIAQDTTLDAALKNLDQDARRGRDLSRQIVQATQGYSALERGALGRRLREANAGLEVNRYLETHAEELRGKSVTNSVRAAGASSAAISSGGLAVFDAIRSVQEAGDTIKRPFRGVSRTDFDRLELGLNRLAQNSVQRSDIDRLRDELRSDMKETGVAIERRVTANLDAKLDRNAFDEAFTGFRREILSQLNTKVDAGTLRELTVSLDRMNEQQNILLRRVKTLETRDPGGGGRIP